MSREFKFRAWNPKKPEMIMLGNLKTINWDIRFIFTHYEIMQYTGCKDSTGREIYEGDIIEDFTTESIWAVTWNPEAAGWTDKQDNPYSYGLYKSLEHCMTVIGNIYQNPDLLR